MAEGCTAEDLQPETPFLKKFSAAELAKPYVVGKNVAHRGDKGAQFRYGQKFHEAEQFGRAACWYKKSADQGYSEAQFALGMMYLEDNGVKQDTSKAVALIKKAADQNLPEAQWFLGLLYQFGKHGVVQKNIDEAIRLYTLAATKGLPDAIESLKKLGINPPPIQKWYNTMFTRKNQGTAATSWNPFATKTTPPRPGSVATGAPVVKSWSPFKTKVWNPFATKTSPHRPGSVAAAAAKTARARKRRLRKSRRTTRRQ
jgi:TPR repeat protein